MNLLLKKRTVLIVQCRLSSTRLPRKALLPLGDKCVLEWVLRAMKKVPADKYYLATDTESAPELEGIAKKCGWHLFAGSKEDVLDRFCGVIKESKAKLVVRATADNPFLFYEAVRDLIKEYYSHHKEESNIDYITYTGLPHGSGVEMFDAESLLRAASMTNDPYDHEHVGPALYNHKESFRSLFIKAPAEYNYSKLRTTIDTPSDYRRACALVYAISGNNATKDPYTYNQILEGLKNPSVCNPVLFVPSVQKGRGTGHLYRCLELAIKTGGDVYIPDDFSLEECNDILERFKKEGLQDFQITNTLEYAEQYKCAITDLFAADEDFATSLSKKCPVIALDEGGENTQWADYLLDIIPSVDIERKANKVSPGFISLPEKRRNISERPSRLHTALVVLGGEDPASLGFPSACALASSGMYVTLISTRTDLENDIPNELKSYIKITGPINNLREHLVNYDLVVTHYGFTAFEAAACGCAVILLATTPLHEKLANTYGYKVLKAEEINADRFKYLLSSPESLYAKEENIQHSSLSDFIKDLALGERLSCPICQTFPEKSDIVVARTEERTFRRCAKCGMLYMSWTMYSNPTSYDHAYFYEDYQKQYGKTYEEDMAQIKAQGVRRLSNIEVLYRKGHNVGSPSILDIGCALGAFLDVANHSGWQVYGIDISMDAVEYVKNKMKFPAMQAEFPKTNIRSEFGVDKFDAVTMWYVIEHFKDLDSVLSAVGELVKVGGVFAFSTPSASGVSGKYNTQTFFEQSPADHYSLWESKRAASILKKYGFKVERIVSTGIHPERFPSARKNNWEEKDFQFKALRTVSKVFNLGDTFEVYCKKVK